MKPELYEFDRKLTETWGTICGVDEAGRGPLCGPVAVAAVILDPQAPILGVDDSKKLSEKKREALYQQIMEKAFDVSVVLVQPEEIDKLNILHATMKGMAQAISNLKEVPALALIDGNRCPPIDVKCQAVVKGDANSAAIAAASIVAKVTRDHYMIELDKEYPQYQLAKHKGYPTKLHYELLDAYGVAPFYRKSFLKKRGYV